MKYGEIQAVVQLAVGLNVGIFALTELSLPYIKKQKKYLKGIQKSIWRAEMSINNNEDHQTRELLRGRLAIVEEKFTSHSVKTENDWWWFGFFLKSMIIAAILGFITGLWILYDTSVLYNSEVPNDILNVIKVLYLPLVVGTGMNLLARAMAYFKIRKQNSIREEIVGIF